MSDKKPAVFFERDGVINVARGHVLEPEDFEWTPGAVEAIKLLNDSGYLVIVVTNQLGIAQGYGNPMKFMMFSRWINEQLWQYGARIDATYHCPHHPTEGRPPYDKDCKCRKPKPGMFNQAMEDFPVDVEASICIGASEVDMQAAKAAGVPKRILFDGVNLLETVKATLG